MNGPSPYMTPAETIDYLRLKSRGALQRLMAEHRLPFLRLGGKLRFDTRELDAWLRGTTPIELARARRHA